MADAMPAPPAPPAPRLAVIQNINSEVGHEMAQTYLAEGGITIWGLTTETDKGLFSTNKRDWATRGIELVFVARGDHTALRDAIAGAEIIVVNPDYNYYLQEHSSNSLAFMTKKPVEEIAEAKDTIAAAAAVQGLSWLVLSMLPAAESAEGSVLRAKQVWAKERIEHHLDVAHPALAAGIMLLGLEEEVEVEDHEEEKEEEVVGVRRRLRKKKRAMLCPPGPAHRKGPSTSTRERSLQRPTWSAPAPQC
jgi:hypothetical protein